MQLIRSSLCAQGTDRERITSNVISYAGYSQSPTGIWSTAWRKTGSTFVYTLLVRSDEECSNNFCVTAVDTPFWASTEPNVFRLCRARHKRKTFGSVLAQRGVSTAVTQRLLELSSSELTNKIYTNVDHVLRQSVNQLPIEQWLGVWCSQLLESISE